MHRYPKRLLTALAALLTCVSSASTNVYAQSPPLNDTTAVTYKVSRPSQRLEMVVNSSRLLTLDKPIPKIQVHNQKILRAMPIGPAEIQISAQAAGVTQLNLWDDQQPPNLYTVDVVITGDSRELEALLATQFPSAALKVTVLPTGAIISGTVTDGDEVETVIAVCEQFYPNVVNNIRVAGVQSVLLHTKVLEISRTKLRALGIDLGYLNSNFIAVTGMSEMLNTRGSTIGGGIVAGSTTAQARVGGIFGANTVDTLIKALRQNELVKVVAEPTVVAIHGRPAKFTAGGRFPIVIPAGNNQVTVQFVEFGTVVNLVAFVLNENRLRLEVRPEISELDPSRGVTLNGTTIPGIRQRYVETSVEMDAGQTLALAGLIQSRTESVNAGFPFFADLPYAGVLFRRVQEQVNDIEVLFLITPEFASAMEPHQVPLGGPGLDTTSPSDCELYWKGYMEVPINPMGAENCGTGESSVITNQHAIPMNGGQLPPGNPYN